MGNPNKRQRNIAEKKNRGKLQGKRGGKSMSNSEYKVCRGELKAGEKGGLAIRRKRWGNGGEAIFGK